MEYPPWLGNLCIYIYIYSDLLFYFLGTPNFSKSKHWIVGSRFLFQNCWLVVSNMNFIFHFIYGMASFPLMNSFFSGWLLPTTNRLLLFAIFFPALPLFGWFNHQPLINVYRRFPFSKFCFTFCWKNPDESIWGSTFRADFPSKIARTLWAWSASKMGTGFCWKRPLGRQRWVETDRGERRSLNLPNSIVVVYQYPAW